MTKPFVQENFNTNPQLQRFQNNMKRVLDPLREGVWGDGNLVKDVATTTGTIIIVDTQLPQAAQGWDLIRPRCTYEQTFTSMGSYLLEVMYDSACLPPGTTWDPDRQVAFLCFFDGLVDIWFY